MTKKKFKEGDLITMESKWLPKSGVIISFAHYAPLARAHAQGNRTPCWNVLCDTGNKFIVGEAYMRLVQRNETIN